MFKKNKNIVFKSRRSKVTDYAALINSIKHEHSCKILHIYIGIIHDFSCIDARQVRREISKTVGASEAIVLDFESKGG